MYVHVIEQKPFTHLGKFLHFLVTASRYMTIYFFKQY